MPNKERISINIYPSIFVNESRILNITKALADAGIFDKIYILAIQGEGLPGLESLDSVREVVRLPVAFTGRGLFSKIMKNLEWSIKILHFSHNKKITCINCHSLPVLPMCVLLKLLKHAKLVYEPHELETETQGSKGIKKKVFKLIESILIRHANVVITVSDSIARWYEKKYSLKKVYSIKNIPRIDNYALRGSRILKDKFKINNGDTLYIYQGGLFEHRGIRILLDVFSKMPLDRHIVFMGFGQLEQLIKEHELNFSNIHFQPAVEPRDIPAYTSSADVGIALIENICLNHYYALPNKIFEYLLSGLPIIVSDFPDMGKFIDKYDCGWKIPVSEKVLTELLMSISKDDIAHKGSKVLICRDKLGSELETEALLEIYQSAVGLG